MIDALLHSAGDQIALAITRARERHAPVLVTLSAPIAPPEDLLGLLQQAGVTERRGFWWERPAERFAIAGLGGVLTFSARGEGRFAEIAAASERIVVDAIADAASQAIGAPFFVGGFAFSSDAEEAEPWRGFPSALMVLPRLLIMRRDQNATLTANCLVPPDADRADILHHLRLDLERLQQAVVCPRNEPSGDPLSIRYEAPSTPPVAQWKQAVAATVDDIAHGRLEKLVLARSCTVAANRLFDCARILRHLRQAYSSCTLFWMATAHGDFLGATPEPLVRLNGQCVSTAAIAGSTAPGLSTADACALAQALKQSDKDRLEHAIVVRAIAEILAPLCDTLELAPEPQLLRLDNVQHLMTPITGQLRTPQHILELVARLHPSPAVAGHPRDVALRLLPQREALDRGWYAGPIGWMDARHQGEFVVAIRSALVRGTKASLYAGAGIVAGSDPEAELVETRLKLQPLLSALLEP
jgi:isochorismate synthase